MPVDFRAIIARLSVAGPIEKRNLNVFPKIVLSDEEMKAAKKRLAQFSAMQPDTADYRAAEEFLYPDGHFDGRTEYTDEESATIRALAYDLQRRRHTGQA